MTKLFALFFFMFALSIPAFADDAKPAEGAKAETTTAETSETKTAEVGTEKKGKDGEEPECD